ncbi:MAG: hypothetical protein ABI584_08425 [Acidobacteriota bacterium]
MKKLSLFLPLGFAAAVLSVLPGCSTNIQGDSASPVFCFATFQLLPLTVNVASNAPVQFQTTILTCRLKSTTSTSLQFMDTQMDQYTVVWNRLDGGTVASPTQTFGGNVTVPPNGTSTLTNYPFMSADSLIRPPLDQLFPFNGGVDKQTGRAEIRQAGRVTWYGHTLSGQAVASDVATFDLIFIYSPISGRIELKRAK